MEAAVEAALKAEATAEIGAVIDPEVTEEEAMEEGEKIEEPVVLVHLQESATTFGSMEIASSLKNANSHTLKTLTVEAEEEVKATVAVEVVKATVVAEVAEEGKEAQAVVADRDSQHRQYRQL